MYDLLDLSTFVLMLKFLHREMLKFLHGEIFKEAENPKSQFLKWCGRVQYSPGAREISHENQTLRSTTRAQTDNPRVFLNSGDGGMFRTLSTQ